MKYSGSDFCDIKECSLERLTKKRTMPRSVRGLLDRFFEPLIKPKHLIWIVLASIIIAITLYIYTGINTGIAEVVRQNSYPLHILSAELLMELGPDYTRAGKDHEEMMQRYIEHMEKRDYAFILRILHPEYSPEKSLASVMEALEKAVKDDKDVSEDEKEERAKSAIWQAGLATNELYMLGNGFHQSPIQWFESEIVSYRLLTNLNNEFDTFHGLVSGLKNIQTLDAAVDMCRELCIISRRDIRLLFLARLGYDNKEKKIERFLNDLEKARNFAWNCAATKDYISEQGLFKERAENIDFRADVVNALLEKDMVKVCKIIADKIQEKLKEKKSEVS